MAPPFVRSPYNYDVDKVSDETGLACKDPSLTRQSEAEEADINTIVRRFGLTGQLPQISLPPTYADFDDVFDFHTAQNMIVKSRESFMALPADVRFKFNNDPGLFVDYVDAALERGELDELRKMGLAVPKPADGPAVVGSSVEAGAPGAGAAASPKGG